MTMEYRVMHTGDAFQIQERTGKETWETVGEFDDLEAARKMVNDLRSGSLCD